MTPDDKYSRPNMQFFWQQIQTLYLKKEGLFVDFGLHFWNVHEIYNILKTKKEYPSLIITEIIASERDVYLSL